MNNFELPIGKNGGKIKFEITPQNQLKLSVKEKGEVYNLTFRDCVFANRYTHDPHMRKMAESCGVFTDKSNITTIGNKVIFETVLVGEETGKEFNEVTAHNIFTVSEDASFVKMETYFEENGRKLYDCGFFNARIEIEKGFFDTVGIPSENIEFSLEKLSDVVESTKALALSGNGKYLKVCGGLVNFDGECIDAHIDSMRYNDDVTYYGKDNPLQTYIMFEDVNVFENENKENELADISESITLDGGKMKACVCVEENSLALISEGKKYPLCAMRFKNLDTEEDVYIDTLSHWEDVSLEKSADSYIFMLSDFEGGKGISLKIIAEPSAKNNQIEWKTEVINNSENLSLFWCTYPRLHIKEKRKCDIFEPIYGGNVRKGFSLCNNYTGGTYPSGFWYTLPYLALFEDAENPKDGIYFSVHDESGATKEFYACCDNHHNIRFSSRFYAENMYQPKNSNILPGKAVWKTFDGDWYDATNIYRDFVRNNCYWAEEKTDKKTPDWMKDIPFWIMDWVPYDADSKEILPTALRCDEDVIGDNDWYENAIKIRKEFDTPIGYHVYNWHQIPFNNNYPHFVPARERFLEGYKELKKNDIRVMPYINAILWDTEDDACHEHRFKTSGIKGAVKKADGEPETLVFESKRENGEPVRLAPMCPDGDIWKNMLINLTGEMFKKYDFDAIYLDQIAARVPHLCMDKNHSHPLGGGSWWQKGYNDIVKALNENKPEDKGFTTECNAEVYTNTLNGFLSWRWNLSENDVPAFMRIYSDRVVAFGRNTNGKIKNDAMYWKYNIASEFVCGQQLGWINSDIVKKEYRMNFLKKLARFRFENREFFRNFEVLRPPVVVTDADNTVRADECIYSVKTRGKSYLCTGVLSDGKNKMMLIVNIADREITSDIKWKNDEYNFNQSEIEVFGDGKVNSLNNGKVNVTVEKESYVCIKWK